MAHPTDLTHTLSDGIREALTSTRLPHIRNAEVSFAVGLGLNSGPVFTVIFACEGVGEAFYVPAFTPVPEIIERIKGEAFVNLDAAIAAREDLPAERTSADDAFSLVGHD